MDKPLSNIGKDNDADEQMVKNQAQSVGGAYVPELSQKNWEEGAKNLRWDATPEGRAIERVFTRGGLGAAAFAWGQWYAGRGGGVRGYHSELSWGEVAGLRSEKGAILPLTFIAKAIDSTAGNAIKATAKFLGAKNPESLVRFRPTNNMTPQLGGRSLGHEAVGITFDFFCASVGDAAGREIHDLLDPHVKHTWKDEKGHINPLEAAKSVGKSVWRYVSYNGGEDWAVAVPYAFYLRGQRNLINKFSPGFMYDSDRALNGASFKVNGAGNVTGNYNLAGMLDLQGRFTAYNVGTLMYREAYSWADNALHGHHTKLYGSPDGKDDKGHGIVHDAGDLLKWTARSAIKGVITMTPAVPFFSIFRTPQMKYRGIFINPQNETVLGYAGDAIPNEPNGLVKHEALYAHEPYRDSHSFKFNTPVNFQKFDDSTKSWQIFSAPNHPLNDSSKPFDAYAQHGGVLNSIGKVQSNLRDSANNFAKTTLGTDLSNRSMSTYWNAAFAYTPYMFAKRESAILWDNGKTDLAAERLINGATNLNYKEFKAGGKELWRAILHKPFSDPMREAEAHRRSLQDTSPADGMTKENYEALIRENEYNSQLSWRERIIHAHKEKDPEALKSKSIKKRGSHADEAAQLKFLQDAAPPTNSIH